MTRDETDKIAPGTGVVIFCGKGQKYAHVEGQSGNTGGGLVVRKWSRSSKTWSRALHVPPGDVHKIAAELQRQVFYVDGTP